MEDNVALDTLLISLVQERGNLYNKSRPDYKDKIRKENAWREISEITNIQIGECQNRWLRMRERFGKETRELKMEPQSDSELKPKKPWPHFNSLKWLEKYISPRKTVKELNKRKRSCDEKLTAVEPWETVAVILDESCGGRNTPSPNPATSQLQDISPIPQNTPDTTFPRKKNKPDQLEEMFLTTFQSFRTLCDRGLPQNDDDSDVLLTKSILVVLKKLTKQRKKQAKRVLHQFLLDFDEDSESDELSSV